MLACDSESKFLYGTLRLWMTLHFRRQVTRSARVEEEVSPRQLTLTEGKLIYQSLVCYDVITAMLAIVMSNKSIKQFLKVPVHPDILLLERPKLEERSCPCH